MKYFFLFFISLYQLLISPFLHTVLGLHHACRYPVTCSDYAKQQIRIYGVLRGGFLAGKRFLSCNPFAKAV